MKRRIKKNDIIFIIVVLCTVFFIAVIFYRKQEETGTQVLITVQGQLYGEYSLKENQEVPIVTDGITTNLLMIEDGKAKMAEADCPDKLCVHQRAVSKKNETIVCLPNKVVVSIAGGEESEFDSIAK